VAFYCQVPRDRDTKNVPINEQAKGGNNECAWLRETVFFPKQMSSFHIGWQNGEGETVISSSRRRKVYVAPLTSRDSSGYPYLEKGGTLTRKKDVSFPLRYMPMPVFNFSTRTSAGFPRYAYLPSCRICSKKNATGINSSRNFPTDVISSRSLWDYTDSDSRTTLHSLIRARASIARTICDLFVQ